MRPGGVFTWPGSGQRDESRCAYGPGRRRRRSASTATFGRSSRTTASPATVLTRRSARPSFTSTRRKARLRRTASSCPGNAAESMLIKRITNPDPEEADAAARFRARADRETDRAAAALDRRRREVGYALGLHAAGAPGAAAAVGQEGRLGPEPDRSLHPRAARARRAEAVAGSRQGDAAAPRHLRPDRAAADAGRGRRLSRRPFARRLRTARRRAPAVAALRRADGRAVARRRALCRHARLPHRQPARHVAVARLGHRRLQPQPAVRPVRDRAAGRRPAARMRRASRRWRPASTATT